MGLFRKKYTADEVLDIIMPVAERSHVLSVYVAPSSKKKRYSKFGVAYNPDADFDLEDYKRMQAVSEMFPPGVCTMYQSFWDRSEGYCRRGFVRIPNSDEIKFFSRFYGLKNKKNASSEKEYRDHVAAEIMRFSQDLPIVGCPDAEGNLAGSSECNDNGEGNEHF